MPWDEGTHGVLRFLVTFLSFVMGTTPPHDSDSCPAEQVKDGRKWTRATWEGIVFCHCLLSDSCPDARVGNTSVVLEWAPTLLNSLKWPV